MAAPAPTAPPWQPWPYGTATGTVLADQAEPSSGTCLRDYGARPGTIRRGEEHIDSIITLEELVPLLNRTKCWPTASGAKGVWMSENKGVLSHYSPRRECAQEVPRLMHFLYLGRPLKEKYAANINAFVEKNPGWQAYLWIEKPLPESAAKSLSAPQQGQPCIIKNYTELIPRMRLAELIRNARSIGAAADWLRLEIIYAHGGIYMDTDSFPVHGFDEYGSLFRWPFVTYAASGGGICNCIFGDSPGSAFMNFTIAAAYEITTRFKFNGPLKATGPPLVNSAFVMYNNPEYVLIESDNIIKHRKKKKQIMYQTFDYSWQWKP